MRVVHDGIEQEVSFQQALQHQTYRDAIAGKKLARRDVIGWIEEREKARAKANQAKRTHNIPSRFRKHYPDINEALLLLGMVERDHSFDHLPRADPYLRLLLKPEVVQRALGRRLSKRQIADIERCTRDSDKLKWPRGTEQ